MIVAAVGFGACDEKLSDITGPTPDLVPKFDGINQLIFQSNDSTGRPACVQCHTGRIPGINLNVSGNVDSYAPLVNVPSRHQPNLMLVAPGDPDNSYLIHKLEGRSTITGLRMPRTPYLTEGQIRVIKRWIALGAPR